MILGGGSSPGEAGTAAGEAAQHACGAALQNVLALHVIHRHDSMYRPGREDLMDRGVVPENLPAPPDCLPCSTSQQLQRLQHEPTLAAGDD